jgi:hypothetical protein
MEHQIIYAAGRIDKAVSARKGLSNWKGWPIPISRYRF